MGEKKSAEALFERLGQVLPRARAAKPATRSKRWLVTPENARYLENELRFQEKIIERTLSSYPRKFAATGDAKAEWRRLANRAAEEKDNPRRARAAERAERHWKVHRARDHVRAGLSLLSAGRFGDAVEHLIEAWYWGPQTIAAAFSHSQRQKGARASANARKEYLANQQEIALKYETELPKARAQIAAQRPSLKPDTLERLADKLARRWVAKGLGVHGDAGRKRVARALARGGKMKTGQQLNTSGKK